MGDESNETIRTTLVEFKRKLNAGELNGDPPPAGNKLIIDTFIAYIRNIDNRVSVNYATQITNLLNEFQNTETKYVYNYIRNQLLIKKIDAILNKLDIPQGAVPITRTMGKNQQPPTQPPAPPAQKLVGGKKRRSKRHKKRHKKRNRKTLKRK